MYINLSAAELAGLFQPGCLLRRLGDFSCLWDPERGPAARPCQVPALDQQQQAAPWSRWPLAQPRRHRLRPRGPHGPHVPCGTAHPGERGARWPLESRRLVVSPPPQLSSPVLFCCYCNSSNGYLLFAAPPGLLSHPSSPAPMEGSSFLRQEADASHWAANFGGLAGVTILTWWLGGMLMYRYTVINGKFTLSLRRQVSTGGGRQTCRHHLSLPQSNTFSHKAGYSPHIHVTNFSIIPACTTEHI